MTTTREQDDDALVQVFPLLDHYYRIGMSEKGRGLFALHDIQPRTLLHVAPCIEIKQQEYQNHMRHTVLEHYLFNASAGNKLLALGHGSLFNHSSKPNVDYRVAPTEGCIRYYSGHAMIRKEEELCISYGRNLWFDDKDGSVDEFNTESSDEDGEFLNKLQL